MNNKQKALPHELWTDKGKSGNSGFYQSVGKRVLDVVCSVAVLPFALLILLPCMFAVLLEDGRPVFYRSRRIGRNFTEFDMFKLRTMKVGAPDVRNEDGSTYNAKNDPRVTKTGRFLRESSLDELPQLFNVLLGQMSIIGPRPGDVESKDTYREDEKDKLLVLPGITGYTQAYFRNSISVRDKRLLDAWYAHHISFRLDLRVLLRTVRTVIHRENLYTVPEVPTGERRDTAAAADRKKQP